MTEWTMTTAQRQQELARDRQAINQCQECRTFRLDAAPPTVHHGSCSAYRPEQSRVLRVGNYVRQGRR